jgi:two-component system C4-dicarboxylate transport sensor histidine kinase DctB
MMGLFAQRIRWAIPGFLVAVAVVAGAVWHLGFRQALDQLALQAEADLALASDRLSTQLQIYQELAVLMAEHPVFRDLDPLPANNPEARQLLLEVADKTGALDVAFVDPQGRVLAAAQMVSGADLSQAPAFQRAMQGALGSDHGVIASLGRRAYFYAAPAFAASGAVRGALIVTADVEDIEQTWRGSLPAVYFTDASGEVFISNRSELLFWRRVPNGTGLRPSDGAEAPVWKRDVGRHRIWNLDWGPYVPEQALHLSVGLPVIGMQGEILVDVAPAQRIALLQAAAVAAVFLAFGALLYMTTERRRALAQANAVLETRVAARTRDLSLANTQLRREVVERQDAEAALKRAQADLVQAGKLSALGQMSAGISHELNQPLMAIRQYADNGVAFMERGKVEKAGENLGRIADLASRMARIIKNLRSFARNESEPMGRVDIGQVLNTAVELTGARLRTENVVLEWDPPDTQVLAWGGEVRLGQVFVNLINNAVDAMENMDDKKISIRIEAAERVRVHVTDSGPGIEDPERIFEPFYSTKAVGSSEGMGLGLSISYGLVQSFGGNIRGANAATGGAIFTVELEFWSEEKAA